MARRHSVQKQMIEDALRVLNHPTAQDILLEVKKAYPYISMGTVYRNLNILTEEGFVKQLYFPDSPERFELHIHDHDHLLCNRCGKIIDIDGSCCDDIDEKIASKTGFVIESHTIVFQGVCAFCIAREKNEKDVPE